jgi:hypothetical protein
MVAYINEYKMKYQLDGLAPVCNEYTLAVSTAFKKSLSFHLFKIKK